MFWTKKKLESYFSYRLTFSNIHSRTSHRIYRLALPLFSPETLSAIGRPDNKHNCCRTGEECEEFCLRRGLNCGCEDVKRNRGNSLAL